MSTMRSRLASLRSFSREARLLLAIGVFFGLAYNGIGLLLRGLYVLRLGLGAAYYGLYSATGSFAYMAACLTAGLLAMRWGARKTMLIGAVGCLAGAALMPLTEFFDPATWRVWPIASNLLVSPAWALVIVPLIPALTGVVAEGERDRIIGLANTLSGVGVLLGNLLGGLLPRLGAMLLGQAGVTNDGFRLALCVTLGFGMAVIALLLLLPPQPARAQAAAVAQEPLRWTPLLVVGLFAFLIQSASAAMSTFSAPYLDQELHYSTAAIGLVTTAGQALAVAGVSATPWLARRMTSRGGAMLVGAGTAVALLPMAAIPVGAAAIASRVAVGALNMIRIPITQMFALAQLPQTRRALMSGVLNTAGGLCLTAVGYLGGLLAASQGYRAVFWVAAGITGAGVLLFGLVTRALIAAGHLQQA